MSGEQELPDIGELVDVLERASRILRFLAKMPGLGEGDRISAFGVEKEIYDLLVRAGAAFNTDMPETAKQSVAKTSEDNGRISAAEGAPMAGEVSRASVGAASDADDGRNAEASGGAAPVVTNSELNSEGGRNV